MATAVSTDQGAQAAPALEKSTAPAADAVADEAADAAEPLTDANKARCVIRVVSHRLLECRLPEIIALRRGFHTIKWSSLVALFTGDELQELKKGAQEKLRAARAARKQVAKEMEKLVGQALEALAGP